jgi:hypothetical protein
VLIGAGSALASGEVERIYYVVVWTCCLAAGRNYWTTIVVEAFIPAERFRRHRFLYSSSFTSSPRWQKRGKKKKERKKKGNLSLLDKSPHASVVQKYFTTP